MPFESFLLEKARANKPLDKNWKHVIQIFISLGHTIE